MKLMRITFFCTLLFIASNLFAQNPGIREITVNGTITDSSNVNINNASVALLLNGATLVKTVQTENGKFQIRNVKPGSYKLEITCIGFNKYANDLEITGEKDVMDLPAIKLSGSEPVALAGVVVSGKKPFIERKLDRTIVNVDALISNVGANAYEVLEKSPGIGIDESGAISLNGNQGVLVLIDDKPTYLSGSALINFLKSITSSGLDKIEIMQIPPAKYDAAGSAGAINIRTKRNNTEGINGNFTLNYGQGIYSKSNNSANINYKKRRLTLSAGLSYILANEFSEPDMNREFKNPDGSLISGIRLNSFGKSRQHTYNGRLAADYSITDRTTLGIALGGIIRPYTERNTDENYFSDALRSPDSTMINTGRNKETWKNRTASLSLNHKYASGQELAAAFDYIRYSSDSKQDLYSETFTPENASLNNNRLFGDLLFNLNIYAGKIDYSHPFKGGGNLELGVKSSYTRNNFSSEYFNTVKDPAHQDYDKSYRFHYDENVSAGYVNFKKEMGRIALQAGLRVENTVGNGHQTGGMGAKDSSFRRSYFNYFPSAYFSYKLGAESPDKLILSYGRRITRPYYEDLNPAVFYMNQFSYYSGNPYLKPELSHNVELTFSHGSLFTATMSYANRKDRRNQTFQQIGQTPSYVLRPNNLATTIRAGLSVTANIPVLNWWNCNIYSYFYTFKYKGDLFSKYIDISANTYNVTVTNQFKISSDWSAELMGFYNTRNVQLQYDMDPYWYVNAAVQKKVLKGKGSLNLSVKDIFYRKIIQGDITSNENVGISFENIADTRVVSLSFTYKFGRMEMSRSKKESSAEDEQKRVKSR